MADNKFDLNARIHQGYEPNTEFNFNSNLFSTLRFSNPDLSDKAGVLPNPQDNANDADASTLPLPVLSGDDGNIIQNSSLPFSNQITSGSANGGQVLYYDPLSSASAGGDYSNILEGLTSRGINLGNPDISSSFLSRATGPGGGFPSNDDPLPADETPDNTNPDDDDDDDGNTPHLTAPVVTTHGANSSEGDPIPLDIQLALDTQQGVTTTIIISNLPPGATLSAGTNNGNGSWTLTPAQIPGLILHPGPHYSGQINLTVSATSTLGNLSSNDTETIHLVIESVANTPNLVTFPAFGNEDTAIQLNISSSLNDTDGSEHLSITVSGVPAGATLSAGTNNGNGTWSLTPAQLSSLSVTPPLNYSGSFSLNVTATSTDGSDHASVSSNLVVSVAGIPDQPFLSVQPSTGLESSPIPLNISASLTDTDGSETLSITISGVPAGGTLSAGINNGNGTWSLTQAELSGLTLTPPLHYSGTVNLSVTASSHENNLTSSTSQITLPVTITAVSHAPVLSISEATGSEDNPIVLNIDADPFDPLGNEVLTVTISNLPSGATLSAGLDNGNGTWTLTPAQLVNLQLLPPLNYSGHFDLSITLTSVDGSDIANVHAPLGVTIEGVADTPNLSVQAASGSEETDISLSISASLNDTDGSEVLSILISGVPSGALLSAGLNNGNGSWTLSPAQLSGLTITPPGHFSGIIAMQVSAISTESNGDTSLTSVPLTLNIQPVANQPVLDVSAAIGQEDSPITLSISALLADLDTSETLSITISGVPAGAFLSAGINQGNGTWLLTSTDLVNLQITPPANSDVDFTLVVTATATDSNGTTSSIIDNLPVTVMAVADIPTVTTGNTAGAKNTAVNVNISGALTDTDGSESITYLISGVPDGFSFNHGLNNGNNSWTFTENDLAGLKMISPYNFEGRVYLSAQSVSHESDGSVALSNASSFNIGVGNASAGIQLNLALGVGIGGIGIGTAIGLDLNLGGLLSNGGIVVHEDSIFPIVDAGLLLTLAANISFLTINGLPVGASLSSGVDQGNGQWRLLPGDLVGLSLRLPPNSDQDFTITISAQVLFLNVALGIVNVHVLGVADTPTLTVLPAIANEDANIIPISVSSSLTDTDGSETLSFTITNLPAGFVPTVGINNGNGTWSLTATEIASFGLKPPEDFSGDATYTIIATSTEREGDSTTQIATGHIHITASADAPVVEPVQHTGTEDTPLHLDLGISLTDTSETLSSITISGLEAGFGLIGATNNGNGTWSVNPGDINNVYLQTPHDWSGDTSLTITATSRESNGHTQSTTANLNVHIEAAADVPPLSVQDVSGIENHHIGLDIVTSSGDTDGSENLSVVISQVPNHFTFNAGLNNGNGTWSFREDEMENLSIIPEHDFTGDIHLTVDIFSQDDHSVATNHADFIVHVSPDT